MERKILVEVSARHVHVSREHLDILFGKNYELTVKKELSQPGQYAANERVDIVGPKRELKNVSILGPVRKATQVEISMTDARSIVAKRHIHLTPEDAKKFNVKDKEIVSVKIETDQRSTILGDVVIRVREDFASAMHIDTDEGNAVGISGETYGTII